MTSDDPDDVARWRAFRRVYLQRMWPPCSWADLFRVWRARAFVRAWRDLLGWPREVYRGWRDLTGCPRCALAVAAVHADVDPDDRHVVLLRDLAFELSLAGVTARDFHGAALHRAPRPWCTRRRPAPLDPLPSPEDVDAADAEEARIEQERADRLAQIERENLERLRELGWPVQLCPPAEPSDPENPVDLRRGK